MNLIRALFHDCRGASAIEFALIVPMVMLLLFGMFEISWLLGSQAVLNHATFQSARMAARAIGEGLTEDKATELAQQSAEDAFWMGTLESKNISVTYDDSGDVAQVKVQSTTSYESLTGWFGDDVIPAKLSSKAVMPLP